MNRILLIARREYAAYAKTVGFWLSLLAFPLFAVLGGAIPVLGVPSASAVGHGKHPPARWHAIEIAPDQHKIRVVARGLSPETGAFEPLGSYLLDTAQG